MSELYNTFPIRYLFKISSHFLTVFYLSQVLFWNIGIKWNLKIMKKKKMVPIIFFQPVQKCISPFWHIWKKPFYSAFCNQVIVLLFLFFNYFFWKRCHFLPIRTFLFWFILQSRPIIFPDHWLPVSSLFLCKYRIRWTLYSPWFVPEWYSAVSW